ncbi:MAG TPA: CocE/NonD family hydrolase [Tepidisphaeraceae bacterium]|jgi:dienelactone hydrolase|nr:CocE/NonD family hydrolase [Tepidisphaeraceae bacterium]
MKLHLAGVAVGGLLGMCAAAAPVTADRNVRATERNVRPATMPYATAHERPLEAVESVVAQVENHTKYRVEFNGIRQRVPANLYIPKDGKKSHPAILLQYGSGGNKNTNYIVAIALKAVERGFVVITIDIPNKGERKNKAAPRLPFEGAFGETLGDYSRAVDYLTSRPEVDKQKLGYVGISWGAITGITFVAHDPRIKVMASLVGGGNFLGWLPPETVTAEAKAAVEEFDPVYHVKFIAPRPLLLLNVTKDVMVPHFMSESLHKAAGEGAKKVWLETDHFFSTVDRGKTAEMVIEFVEDHLKG